MVYLTILHRYNDFLQSNTDDYLVKDQLIIFYNAHSVVHVSIGSNAYVFIIVLC